VSARVSEIRQPVACSTPPRPAPRAGLGGGGYEGATLGLGKVEAAAFGIIELHALTGVALMAVWDCSSEFCNKPSTAKLADWQNYPQDRARRGDAARRADTELAIVYQISLKPEQLGNAATSAPLQLKPGRDDKGNQKNH
jgi:hypothetical protein